MAKNSLLVCISLTVAIALAEIGLRLAGIAYPEFNRLDKTLGWAPRPGVEGFHAMEGRTWMKINAAGFRDEVHTKQKPAHVFRIAILGDSFAEGREVPLTKVFWKVMEKQLRNCTTVPNRKYEVVGFAVNGYGTAQQLIVLKKYVWQYQPDTILLAFFTGNDIWNNSQKLDGHKARPYFTLQENKLVLKNDYLNSKSFKQEKMLSDLKHGIYNQLRTLQIARQTYIKIRYANKNEPLPLAAQLSAGLNNGIYRQPETRAWKQAWKITEALIGTMAEEIRRHGKTQFWITSLSTPSQVYPNVMVRKALAASLGVPDLFYPDRRIAKFAKSKNIPLIPLAHHLQNYAEKNNAQLHGHKGFAGGHWNETGHQIAGEHLAKVLCAAQEPS